jgi:hypothetical protein
MALVAATDPRLSAACFQGRLRKDVFISLLAAWELPDFWQMASWLASVRRGLVSWRAVQHSHSGEEHVSPSPAVSTSVFVKAILVQAYSFSRLYFCEHTTSRLTLLCWQIPLCTEQHLPIVCAE